MIEKQNPKKIRNVRGCTPMKEKKEMQNCTKLNEKEEKIVAEQKCGFNFFWFYKLVQN